MTANNQVDLNARVESASLLSSDELALPAICGQTGCLFVMVARRQSGKVLEIVRAVPIKAEGAVGVQVCHPDRRPQKQSRAVVSPTNPGTWANPEPHATAFQHLALNARVEIGSRYDGCPYCRARGYFRCSRCG